MKTYRKLNYVPAPNTSKHFPSKIQALAAADIQAPGMKATAREDEYGWTVDIDDGEGSVGSIVQSGRLHWWMGGWRCKNQMEESLRSAHTHHHHYTTP